MNTIIQIFIKSPVSGKVKTRLGVDIGYDHAAEIAGFFFVNSLNVSIRLVR